MCGFSGMITNPGQGLRNNDLVEATNRLSHRGPDSVGFYQHGSVNLGFRRLSIIDVEGGRQPLFNDKKTICLVMNGEIYNFETLRADLKEKGHRFLTGSDAEVLLHLYVEHGISAITELRGMFGFCLVDFEKGLFFLGRDRVGIKPLFYAPSSRGLAFASEIKGLVAGVAEANLTDKRLRHYFSYGYFLREDSPFDGVVNLEPGSYIEGSIYNPCDFRLKSYWDLPHESEYARSEADWFEELQHTLKESVSLHMRSDVPYGAFLSGGIDSSIVVALMSELSSSPIDTFTIDFDEQRVSESRYAKEIATKYRTNHTEIKVKPASLDLIPKLAEMMDEPFADCSVLPSYIVSKEASGFVKVILSGDGGDELFAGYNRYERVEEMRWVDYIPSILKTAPSRNLARLLGPSRRGRGFLLKVAGSPTERLLQDAKFFDDLSLEHLLVAQGPEKNTSGQDQMLDLYLSVEGKSDLERFLRADFRHYMVDDILTKMDRCSMAHGLEVRVPILDHKVVELAFRMPTQLKFNKSIKKYPLKTTFGGHLTESVLNHRKQGFYAPIKEWFAGDLGDYFIDRVFSSDNKSGSLLDRVFVEQLLRDHRAGKRNHAERLWSILMLEEWCRSPLGNRARLV